MAKTITKIGNSQCLMFGSAVMDVVHLKVGDQVTVSTNKGDSIVLTPARPVIETTQAASAAKRLIGKNVVIFRRRS